MPESPANERGGATLSQCDCPARVLDAELIGSECGVCGGFLPPFDEVDELILRHVRQFPTFKDFERYLKRMKEANR